VAKKPRVAGAARRRSTLHRSRVVWKGAIEFGLVHIPVALRTAARDASLDFDWLDKRDMAPVGYQRINKRTGAAIEDANVVKGYEYAKGEYVVLADADFKKANPAATQTVEILAFVDAAGIDPRYFVTPYYLEPGKRGERGYALLREVLRKSNRVGLAKVVIHAKQHLAAVLVHGPHLMLNTMRFADSVLAPDGVVVPGGDLKSVRVGARELQMAERLVEEMTTPFEPDDYQDTYRNDLLAMIDAKVKSGDSHALTEADAPPRKSAQVIDLMSALRASLARGEKRPTAANEARAARDHRTNARKPATKARTARRKAA